MAVKLERALRVATLNVRGLGARRRQYQLSRLCMEKELDVVALQETKVETQEQTDRMVTPFTAHYNVCVCHANGTSGGCALLIRKSAGIIEESVTVSETGRLLIVDFSFSHDLWRLVCVYAPNNVNDRFLFLNVSSNI